MTARNALILASTLLAALLAFVLLAFTSSPSRAGHYWPDAFAEYYEKYVGVDAEGKYVNRQEVDEGWTFKSTCLGCRWRKYDPDTDTKLDANVAKYRTKVIVLENPATGARAVFSADGVTVNDVPLLRLPLE